MVERNAPTGETLGLRGHTPRFNTIFSGRPIPCLIGPVKPPNVRISYIFEIIGFSHFFAYSYKKRTHSCLHMKEGEHLSRLNRRDFLRTFGLLGGGAAIGFLGRSVILPPPSILNNYVAYGGGSNIKYMPDPTTGQPTVPLEELFYFDLNNAFCRVDNNPQSFAMDTYSMGHVTVDANSFYMLMLAEQVSVSSFTSTQGGAAKLELTGTVACDTTATVADTRIGGRNIKERAPYLITAQHDLSLGDSFAFKVFFEPDQAPVNHGIFGPEPNFTGQMKTGGVTIVPVRALRTI